MRDGPAGQDHSRFGAFWPADKESGRLRQDVCGMPWRTLH